MPAFRKFVIVSGLPGSGKSTLGRELAAALQLPLIDKDTILERLFEEKGAGDAAWRRALSRERDRLLQMEAEASENGAVLVSFWKVAGMPEDSGTPVTWLGRLGAVVNVRCICPVDVAVARFVGRTRHPGHLDGDVAEGEIARRIAAAAAFEQLESARVLRWIRRGRF